MDLYTGLTPFAVAFVVVALVAGIAALAATVDVLVRNRKQRLARHESIPTYYRGLVVSH